MSRKLSSYHSSEDSGTSGSANDEGILLQKETIAKIGFPQKKYPTAMNLGQKPGLTLDQRNSS